MRAAQPRECLNEKDCWGVRFRNYRRVGGYPLLIQRFSPAISNQQFEHVADLDRVLDELFRVLRPPGMLLALFPITETWREGHCGVPFVHWFGRHSRVRYPYMRLMRTIGLGYFTADKGNAEWSKDFIEWLDKFTVYRSYAAIMKSLWAREGGMCIRLSTTTQHLDCAIADSNGRHESFTFKEVSRFACRRIGGMVILAQER